MKRYFVIFISLVLMLVFLLSSRLVLAADPTPEEKKAAELIDKQNLDELKESNQATDAKLDTTIKKSQVDLNKTTFNVGTTQVLPVEFKLNVPIPGEGIKTVDIGIGRYIRGVYLFGLGFAALLAMGMIVFGGIIYIISRGNPSKITEAKEIIQGAIYGLLLLIGAYVILYNVNPNLVGLNTLDIKEVRPGSFFTPTLPKQTADAISKLPAAEQADIRKRISRVYTDLGSPRGLLNTELDMKKVYGIGDSALSSITLVDLTLDYAKYKKVFPELENLINKYDASEEEVAIIGHALNREMSFGAGFDRPFTLAGFFNAGIKTVPESFFNELGEIALVIGEETRRSGVYYHVLDIAQYIAQHRFIFCAFQKLGTGPLSKLSGYQNSASTHKINNDDYSYFLEWESKALQEYNNIITANANINYCAETSYHSLYGRRQSLNISLTVTDQQALTNILAKANEIYRENPTQNWNSYLYVSNLIDYYFQTDLYITDQAGYNEWLARLPGGIISIKDRFALVDANLLLKAENEIKILMTVGYNGVKLYDQNTICAGLPLMLLNYDQACLQKTLQFIKSYRTK